MKRLSKTENGFSILEVILILVIVAIIGLAGFFVWHAHQVKIRDSKTNSTTATDTPNAASDYVTNGSPQPTNNSDTCSNIVKVNSTTSRFTSKYEPTLSFDFPSSWKVTNHGSYDFGDICDFISPDGAVDLLWESSENGVGGDCSVPLQPNLQVTINSSTPIQNAPGLNVINFTYTGYVGVAVVPASSEFSDIGVTKHCANVFYPFFNSHSSKNLLNLEARMKSDISSQDLESVTAILQSVKY